MISMTEQHTVEIEIAGDRQAVASADLCGDDTLPELRARVALIGGAHFRIALGDREQLAQAFDEAFERCEARPGNDAVGTFAYAGGEIVVTRRLAA